MWPGESRLLHSFMMYITFLCTGLLCRLIGELLRLSDPLHTQYMPHECTWTDAAGHELLGLPTLVALTASLEPPGLAVLDRLLVARCTNALKAVVAFIRREMQLPGKPYPLPPRMLMSRRQLTIRQYAYRCLAVILAM